MSSKRVTSPQVLLATRSEGKIRELRPLFEGFGLSVTDLDEAGIPPEEAEDELERFETFEENALAKATYFFDRTGRPTVADDSGLVVDALGGAPGVLSKRWSGQSGLVGQALDDENNQRLLSALAGVSDRRARYVCVAAYVDERRRIIERGEVTGQIVETPHGANGFGYDPYFLADELGQTFGEVTRVAKEGVSHRGRAFRRLLTHLRLP